MTDLGHPLMLGTFLTPTAADPQRPVELAVRGMPALTDARGR